VILTFGALSGVLGVVYALAQHDLKRLLAYHSVENLGIVLMGAGIGTLGLSAGVPAATAAGFAGAVLHVANHALFKGCLFLGAGAVRHAAGTGDIDRLGGLARRMPTTAASFGLSSAAICGLPPLNGFVSEFCVAYGGVALAASARGLPAALGLSAVACLGLIGGLASLCFVKAFATVFLGRARTEEAARAHEASASERTAMVLLASLCAAIGLAAPLALRFAAPAVRTLAGSASATALEALASTLVSVVTVVLPVVVSVLLLLVLRRLLLRGRDVRRAPTWGCGFSAPTPRMQYSSSSFAAPTAQLFQAVLATKVHGEAPADLHPAPSSYATHAEDRVEERLLDPFVSRLRRALDAFRRLQHGSLHRYLLYMLLTLTALLLWTLLAGGTP
jgi:hydrogenase-4 component B